MAGLLSEKVDKNRDYRTAAGFIWLIQVFSGFLLILLLGLHMIAHHYVVDGGLRNFQDVLDYVSNPLIFVLEVLFLIVVTPHALLGLQNIILDLGPGKAAERAIVWTIRVLMVAIIIYGIWLAIAIQGA